MGTKMCRVPEKWRSALLYPPLLGTRAQTSILPRDLTPWGAHRLYGDGAMRRPELSLVLTQAERRTRCSCTSPGSGALSARPSACLFFRLRAAVRLNPPVPHQECKHMEDTCTFSVCAVYASVNAQTEGGSRRHWDTGLKGKYLQNHLLSLLLKCK